ncbi:hypothetical protein [Prosthecobacter sp.]|uniref:hypothetical protein n=1 Tax=Prosthecobacter sp. TaxID=1965333 RepID=UPI003782E5FE
MKFRKGDQIVRDDTRHPAGTLVVVQHCDNGNLQAYPLGGGFELTIPARDVSRFSIVTRDEATPIYRQARFCLECFEGIEFIGWTADQRWNGWAMPCFGMEQALKLVALLQGQLRYDSSQDAFIGSSGDEEELWTGQVIDLPDGGQEMVYPVGAGSWTWELCKRIHD